MIRGLIGFVIGFVVGLVSTRRARLGEAASTEELGWVRSRGLGQDELVAHEVRREWRRLGLASPLIDATVVDGTLYVRGRTDPETADALVATARGLPGVRDVRDEIQRQSSS